MPHGLICQDCATETEMTTVTNTERDRTASFVCPECGGTSFGM
jgi:predicted RNA-binding Zn-ribbon protein involved in translation (DUF1610 family)